VALLLKNGRVVDPLSDLDEVCDVLVRDGVIEAVGHDVEMAKGETVDCTGTVILPGLVDVHAHLREPGREDEETLASGTRAAATGGFTAVCAMPNTEPVADEGAAVRFLLEKAAADGAVRVHAIGAITKRQEGRALAEIGDMAEEGAVAFSDDGHGVSDTGTMRLAMDYIKRFDRPVVSHCEDRALVGSGVVNEGVVSTRLGLPGWPAAGEEVQVARDIALAELTGCRLHLAHLSTAGSVRLVRDAKARGLAVTCEVTPHHLFLTEDDITVSYETSLKMNPPLRTAEDAAALLEGLFDGTVDCIATDHAPHAAHEKALEFELAPFGTTGLETALALVATHVVGAGKAGWAEVAMWMAHGPRAALGLPGQRIEAGYVADLTIVDPAWRWVAGADGWVSKSRNSAFTGAHLTGRARDVLVGGYFALRGGKVVV
jgi:dihydroorotase